MVCFQQYWKIHIMATVSVLLIAFLVYNQEFNHLMKEGMNKWKMNG